MLSILGVASGKLFARNAMRGTGVYKSCYFLAADMQRDCRVLAVVRKLVCVDGGRTKLRRFRFWQVTCSLQLLLQIDDPISKCAHVDGEVAEVEMHCR